MQRCEAQYLVTVARLCLVKDMPTKRQAGTVTVTDWDTQISCFSLQDNA